MIDCPFNKVVWEEALTLTTGKGKWQGINVENYLFKDKSMKDHKTLPCIVTWALWLVRTEMIFQNKGYTAIQVTFQIRYAYEGVWKAGKVKPPRLIVNLDIDESYASGYFDGVSQGVVKKDHSISFKAAVGEGTNN